MNLTGNSIASAILQVLPETSTSAILEILDALDPIDPSVATLSDDVLLGLLSSDTPEVL